MHIDGGCHCGYIKYEAGGSRNGEHMSLHRLPEADRFRVSRHRPGPGKGSGCLAGQPKIYVKTAESGTQRAHGFCRVRHASCMRRP